MSMPKNEHDAASVPVSTAVCTAVTQSSIESRWVHTPTPMATMITSEMTLVMMALAMSAITMSTTITAIPTMRLTFLALSALRAVWARSATGVFIDATLRGRHLRCTSCRTMLGHLT